MEKPIIIKYEDLLGSEFEFGARGPKKFDCYTLSIEIRKRADKYIPDFFPSINDRIIIHKMMMEGTESNKIVKIPQPTPYCLVGFMIRPPYTSHMGVVLHDCYRFIHILAKARVCVERLDHPMWKKRISGFWEYIGE